MNKHSLFARLVFVTILFGGFFANAQNGTNGEWKKMVYRVIDLKEPEDKKHNLIAAGEEQYFSEMLIKDAMAGKIAAYSKYDLTMNTKMPISDVRAMFESKPDSITVVDPVTGKEVLRVVKKDINYWAIHQFRLLEEWTFNATTGKTNFQIIGIAPVEEVYGDGSLRGTMAVFYVKYADMLNVISRYDKANPTKTFAMRIWDDYFLSDVKPTPAK